MPKCGSQITLCDLPVRFDTYQGCTHNCKYCFTYRKYDIERIKLGEGVKSLTNFIEGKRTQETNWCDWDIPLHWGGLSDPFQPIERRLKNSLECLKVFSKTNYPFIVSTKNSLVSEKEYLNYIIESNCVVQFSAVCEKYDQFETGATPYKERIEAAHKIAKHKRVIIRVQPYMIEVFRDVLSGLDLYAKNKFYGVILEGIKYFNKKPGLEKMGNDFVYPERILKEQFGAIKDKAHRLGLKFYSGENRLRRMGDDLCCCGVDGMGWQTNKANLNHYVAGEELQYTKVMNEHGSGYVYGNNVQETTKGRVVAAMTYRNVMELLKDDKTQMRALGVK
jgi:DNA repair photolyase